MLVLKAERRKRGWNQQQLAVLANIPVAELCKIETGRMKPFPKHAASLEHALGLPLAYLLEEVPEEQSLEVANASTHVD